MIVEVKKMLNQEDGSIRENLESFLSLDSADKVIIHSSKLFYEIPLSEKHIYVMNN